MDKNIWGKHMWNTIHFVALGYPNNASNVDRDNYRNFYINIEKIIPCQECATHLKENLSDIPIDTYLNSREKLFEWTVLLHNLVNKHLGIREWSYDEAYKYYTNKNFNLNSYIFCYNKLFIIIIVLLIIIIFFILCTKYNIFKNICKFKR
jgi:hypothetical protein|tara:strand:- start:232 stop:681 length:450 start_codon:yes stop_codon:yes gene_type:complete